MPNELIPMSTWTPKDGQTYEIVDAEARERLDDAEERLDDLEQGGGGGGGSGTVRSVNNVQPDASGNVTLSIPDELPTVTASDNGKFLRVVSGAWAAETVQTWQGGSY